MNAAARTLVTGATGELGSAVVAQLFAKGTPPSTIVALARDPAKAPSLSSRGLEVRIGDYADPASLRSACSGVEQVLLISATAFSDAATLHGNVISAARDASVERIVYTAIQRPADSSFVIEQVTDWDTATERLLADSGMDVTITHHALYADSVPFIIGPQVEQGCVRAPAGDARAAIVLREDLAEAIAVILRSTREDGASFTLTGPEAVSFADVAAAAGRGLGRHVTYEPVSRKAYVDVRVREGVPEPVAGFMSSWFEAVAADQFPAAPDIVDLLGRPPHSALDWLEQQYRSGAPTTNQQQEEAK